MKSIWLAAFALMYTHLPAQAGVIDFEEFINGDLTTPITAGNIDVTFTCGATPGAANCRTFLYGIGGNAFSPGSTPAEPVGPGTDLGVAALTDTTATTNVADNFHLQFSAPITSLSLDAIDLEFEGVTHVLSLFANADFTDLVGTASFTVPANPLDADTTPFSVVLSGTTALSARFTNGGVDPGVAIDNIAFTTPVAEPGSIGGLGLGLLSIAIANRRRRKSFI